MIMLLLITVIAICRGCQPGRLRYRLCRVLRSGCWGNDGVRPALDRSTLKDLVQFAAIKPYPAAFWAVVNLHPLPLGHNQHQAAHRAQHSFAFCLLRHQSLSYLLAVKTTWLQQAYFARGSVDFASRVRELLS